MKLEQLFVIAIYESSNYCQFIQRLNTNHIRSEEMVTILKVGLRVSIHRILVLLGKG